jgi:hypothetical protein
LACIGLKSRQVAHREIICCNKVGLTRPCESRHSEQGQSQQQKLFFRKRHFVVWVVETGVFAILKQENGGFIVQ